MGDGKLPILDVAFAIGVPVVIEIKPAPIFRRRLARGIMPLLWLKN